MDSLIFYISEKFIDQIYREHVGQISNERIIEEQKEVAKEITGSAALGQLFSILSLKLDGKASKKKSLKEQVKVTNNVADRANIVIKSLLSDFQLKDVSEINPDNPDMFYKFMLPLSVEEVFVQNGNKSLIEVSYSSSRLLFKGTTTNLNWTADSLLNTILYSYADTPINASGIIAPISITKQGEKLIVLVQYIAIFKQSFQSEK
jgi:hypothetical protein